VTYQGVVGSGNAQKKMGLDLTASTSVLVEDKPINAYTKGVWTAELAEGMTRSCTIDPTNEYYRHRVVVSRPPVPIAAYVWYRLPGGDWRLSKWGGFTMEHGARVTCVAPLTAELTLRGIFQ